MQNKYSILGFFHLEMHLSNEKVYTDLELVPPTIAPLLHQYSSLFQEHQGLPSFRSNNHHIHLLKNTTSLMPGHIVIHI